MTFGENLKTIRKEMKLTQQEMANRIGISQSYFADIEHNRKNISLAVVLRISQGLDVSVNKLINYNIKQ
ncbi:helix-turn-helix domain-containing protein [Staphylococcus equorum]|uniref:helix-turn-helix domain-containing protein n=1 Tax=Staphylococcus equorum TaxID=246432 RepID=UPI0025556B7C|nr:helix-turn-helix transcriptional regulator [Staphylococcus equorum]MDK9870086.1 helix-turn-helix transcriptional regulator [Staphylococcus equorum]